MTLVRTSISNLLLISCIASLPRTALAEEPLAATAGPSEASAPTDAVPPSAYAARLDAEFQGGGLTSDEVARRVLAGSPELELRRHELLQAAAQVDKALAAYLPRLTVKAGYTRLSDTGGDTLGNLVAAPGVPAGPVPVGSPLMSVPVEFKSLSNQYALQVGLLLPISDYFLRIAPAKSSADANRASRAEHLAAAERERAANGRLAYYTWVRARLSVVVAEQAVAQARAHLADAEQAYAAGTASRADVLRAESQLASSEQYFLASSDLSAITEQQLRVMTHAPRSEQYRIGEDVRQTPLSPLSLDEAQLYREALSARPEFRALTWANRAQQAQASVERAGALPRLDVFASAAYSNPNPRIFPQKEEFKATWDAGVQLSWILSDAPAALASARAVDAGALATVSERKVLEERVQNELFSARRLYHQAFSSIETTKRGLTAAEESYRVRTLLYKSGKATSVEVLDAESELTRARLEALNANVDVRMAKVRLDHALGRGFGHGPRVAHQ